MLAGQGDAAQVYNVSRELLQLYNQKRFNVTHEACHRYLSLVR